MLSPCLPRRKSPDTYHYTAFAGTPRSGIAVREDGIGGRAAGGETGGEHETQGREDDGVAGPAAGNGTKQLRVEKNLLFGGVGGGFVVGEGG